MPARGNSFMRGSKCSSALTSVPRGLPAPGMHDQPGRLVDHQHVVVLVDDVERESPRARPSVSTSVRTLSATDSPPRTGSRGPDRLRRRAGHRRLWIHSVRREREKSGNISARAWSKRLPARTGALRPPAARIRRLRIVIGAHAGSWTALGPGRRLTRGGGPELSVIIAQLSSHPHQAETLLMMRPSGSCSASSSCVALALSLPGCKTVGGWFGGDKEERTETLEVEQLYAEAKESMREGDYSEAQRYYTRLIARFPFGPYSEQAQLELAYVQYKIGKPEDATSTIDRFIRTYPRHRHIDYAYYLKAVINFDRNVGILTRVFRTDPSARDLNGPTQSFNDFNEVHAPLPEQHLRRRRPPAHGLPAQPAGPPRTDGRPVLLPPRRLRVLRQPRQVPARELPAERVPGRRGRADGGLLRGPGPEDAAPTTPAACSSRTTRSIRTCPATGRRTKASSASSIPSRASC